MACAKPRVLQCPICPVTDTNEYVLGLHIEHKHFSILESQSSRHLANVNAKDVPKNNDSHDPYLPCPEPNCGEQVLWHLLQDHMDFHFAEQLDTTSSPIQSQASLTISHERATEVAERSSLERSAVKSSTESPSWTTTSTTSPRSSNRPEPQRLGRKELGPYAYEKQMPPKLHDLLLAGGKKINIQRLTPSGTLYRSSSISNEISDIIPLLATLLKADSTVARAWLCHPTVQYVTKLKGEGGFCGYRNIQMLFSYFLGMKWAGWAALRGKGVDHGKGERVPGVLELQAMIEEAWDRGFDAAAREETGGIKGTRKYIGTPEVQALLDSLSIPRRTSNFQDKRSVDTTNEQPIKDAKGKPKAHDQLLDYVESYFRTTPSPSSMTSNGTTQTHLPPLYLQQPGHSLTIIGFEIRTDGQRNLLVFDPAFKPGAPVERMLEARSAAAVNRAANRKASMEYGKANRSAGYIESKHHGKSESGDREAGPPTKDTIRKRKSSRSNSGNGETDKTTASSRTRTASGKTDDNHDDDGNGDGDGRGDVGRKEEKTHKHSEHKGQGRQASKLLEAYRRGKGKLIKFREFEVVTLGRLT